MMTNDFEDFPGAVWRISYYTVEDSNVPETEKQKFLDRHTNDLSATFQPPSGLSPAEYSSLYMNHFQKTRQTANDLIDKMSENRVRRIELFEIGNIECLREIEKIESSPEFGGWENPQMVHYFKNATKNYL